MDFIGALSGQLGLSEDQAKALAGTVIGGVRGQLEGEDDDAAQGVDAAVPELGDWSAMAGKFLSKGKPDADEGGLGGMLGGLASAAAGGGALGDAFEAVAGKEAKQTAQVVALLDQFGVDGDKAAMVAPLALSFLKDRLPEDVLEKAMAFAPMLLGDSAPSAGGMVGALGSLFGN
ncbi:MAG: hypothetical protein KC912_06755 [Proteobacteria bacterium]|nr:hypothetical protein [Pseudomonadota bacterium]